MENLGKIIPFRPRPSVAIEYPNKAVVIPLEDCILIEDYVASDPSEKHLVNKLLDELDQPTAPQGGS